MELQLSSLFTHNEKLLDLHKCQLCKDILKLPIECENCESHFCNSCINKFQKSEFSLCGNNCNFMETKPSKILLNLLEMLKFKCVNYLNGCGEVLKYSDFFKHIETCQHFNNKCPYCLEEVLSLGKHIHYDLCKNFPIQCENCCQSYKREEFPLHDEFSCVKAVCSLLKKKYKDLGSYCKKLKEKISKNNQEIKDLKTYCDKLERLVRDHIKSGENITRDSPKVKVEKEEFNYKHNDFSCKVNNEIVEYSLYNEKFIELFTFVNKLETNIKTLQNLSLRSGKLKNKIYHNKSINYFLDLGFKIVYQKVYSHVTTQEELEEIKSLCNENTLACVGGKKINEEALFICCIDQASTVFTITNDKFKANKGKGAFWYYCENESFGFTDRSEITLKSANKKYSTNSLSWHLQGLGGWNLGNITGLNTSNDFEKIIMIININEYFNDN